MPQIGISMSLIITLAVPALSTARHMALLPRPQEIRYGTGRLAIRGLSIRFASSPAPEDLFTASELSSALLKRTGTGIPIQEGHPSGPAILMERTGQMTFWTDDINVLERPAFAGITYGAAAAWQSEPPDRGHQSPSTFHLGARSQQRLRLFQMDLE